MGSIFSMGCNYGSSYVKRYILSAKTNHKYGYIRLNTRIHIHNNPIQGSIYSSLDITWN